MNPLEKNGNQPIEYSVLARGERVLDDCDEEENGELEIKLKYCAQNGATHIELGALELHTTFMLER